MLSPYMYPSTVVTNYGYVLVNGMQLLQCVLPQASEGVCSVACEAQSNLQVMDDFGKFEISTLFYSSISNEDKCARRCTGELVVDGNVFYLGKLPELDESVVVTRYVDTYPKMIELKLRFSHKEFHEHPDEGQLMDELIHLLEDQTLFPPGGSAPHTNVHNRLKDMEIYNRVVTSHYGGKWTSFLANHGDRVIMKKVPGSELHLVLVSNENSYQEVDAKYETIRMNQENEVIAFMIEKLQDRDYEYRELLEHMAKLPAFTEQLGPSMTMLNRFLQSNKEVFWTKKDPEHTTRVGLVSNLRESRLVPPGASQQQKDQQQEQQTKQAAH